MTRVAAPVSQADTTIAVCVEPRSTFARANQPSATGSPADIRVEIADAARFSSLQEQWSDLVLRAAEPNPFLHPAMVAAAVEGASASEAPILLAWQGERLAGVWAFIRSYPRSGTPVRVLKAPIDPIMVNATPVIDSELAERTLSAMLDAIRSAPVLPKILSVSFCNSDGPVMAALQRACLARGRAPAIVRQAVRPKLVCRQDPAAYLAAALSGSRRRKLGQLRRRLATRGHLALQVHRGDAAVSGSLERFMQLEAQGWKGVSGNPLLGTEGAEYARRTVPFLALQGLVEIWELALDHHPVSMAIILRQGTTVFDWKVAYDEKHGDCSPGILLAQDYTASFLGDDATEFADSCAADDTGLLGPLWMGRQGMTDFVLDVRGNSVAFQGLAAIEKCYANARRLAKNAIAMTRPMLRRFG